MNADSPGTFSASLHSSGGKKSAYLRVLWICLVINIQRPEGKKTGGGKVLAIEQKQRKSFKKQQQWAWVIGC